MRLVNREDDENGRRLVPEFTLDVE